MFNKDTLDEGLFGFISNLHRLNSLLYQPSMLSTQFPNHPTVFMTHKAEETEYIFSFFSVKSQIGGFL